MSRALPAGMNLFPQLGAVACGVVLGGIAVGQVYQADNDTPVGLAMALGIISGATLIGCWYNPVASYWLSLGAGMTVSEIVRAGGDGSVWAEPSLLIHLTVLGLVALRVPLRVLPAMWLITLLGSVVLVQRMPGMNASGGAVEMGSLSAIVLVAGAAIAVGRRARGQLAAQQEIAAAERASRELLEERAQIAHELHDVLAHHVSVIAISAEAAPYRVADPPVELTKSFGAIRANALEALTELRRILGLLRATDVSNGSDQFTPQPTLDRLEDLFDNARRAGLVVTVDIRNRRSLTPGVELSAYRIVQEALSNAMKYAPGSVVDVTLEGPPSCRCGS